jgi:hypothetical protein
VGIAVRGKGYLQQLLPSQQPELSQQLKTVAAWADNERKRTATTANENNLSFMTISF